jgi:hypothetical protein
MVTRMFYRSNESGTQPAAEGTAGGQAGIVSSEAAAFYAPRAAS